MDGMRYSNHQALKVFELFHVVSMHMLWCFAKQNCTISITRCFQHIEGIGTSTVAAIWILNEFMIQPGQNFLTTPEMNNQCHPLPKK